MAEKEKVARKSHTLDHRGDRSSEGDTHGRSPIKKDKKEKVNVDTNHESTRCNGSNIVYNNNRELTRSFCLLLLGLFVTNSLSLTHKRNHNTHTHPKTTTTILV